MKKLFISTLLILLLCGSISVSAYSVPNMPVGSTGLVPYLVTSGSDLSNVSVFNSDLSAVIPYTSEMASVFFNSLSSNSRYFLIPFYHNGLSGYIWYNGGRQSHNITGICYVQSIRFDRGYYRFDYYTSSNVRFSVDSLGNNSLNNSGYDRYCKFYTFDFSTSSLVEHSFADYNNGVFSLETNKLIPDTNKRFFYTQYNTIGVSFWHYILDYEPSYNIAFSDGLSYMISDPVEENVTYHSHAMKLYKSKFYRFANIAYGDDVIEGVTDYLYLREYFLIPSLERMQALYDDWRASEYYDDSSPQTFSQQLQHYIVDVRHFTTYTAGMPTESTQTISYDWGLFSGSFETDFMYNSAWYSDTYSGNYYPQRSELRSLIDGDYVVFGTGLFDEIEILYPTWNTTNIYLKDIAYITAQPQYVLGSVFRRVNGTLVSRFLGDGYKTPDFQYNWNSGLNASSNQAGDVLTEFGDIEISDLPQYVEISSGDNGIDINPTLKNFNLDSIAETVPDANTLETDTSVIYMFSQFFKGLPDWFLVSLFIPFGAFVIGLIIKRGHG